MFVKKHTASANRIEVVLCVLDIAVLQASKSRVAIYYRIIRANVLLKAISLSTTNECTRRMM